MSRRAGPWALGLGLPGFGVLGRSWASGTQKSQYPLKKKEYTLDYNNRIPTDYDFTL